MLTEAANVAIHADIVQTTVLSLNFARVFFSGIAHGFQLGVLEYCVVIERDLGIKTDNYKHKSSLEVEVSRRALVELAAHAW
jgi:hypothetical protein